MKPVKQTKFGEDGNCLAACLASLFETSIDTLPVFTDDWFVELSDWSAQRGFVVHRVFGLHQRIAGVYAIACGKSSRGLEHSVVWYDDRMVHDPHPDNTGLLWEPHSILYFVAKDPRG